MTRQSDEVQPAQEKSSGGRRVFLISLALVVGAILTFLAPDDWPSGEAMATLAYRGDDVIQAPVELGTATALDFERSSGDLTYSLSFPGGVPVDGDEMRATISVTRGDDAVQPATGELELRVESPQIGVELIPIVGWDERSQTLQAVRRPPRDAAVVLGLLGAVVVLWVSEALPLFVTSLLIPIVLVVTSTAGAVEATAPFFNPIIVLFFAGFLMAEAMRRTGLDHMLAVTITSSARRGAASLFAAMIAIAAGMSMFMSNTAAAAVLIPIAIAVSEPLEQQGFRRALVLGIAYAATIGGVGSAIGTPANQLAIEFLDEFANTKISFAGWFAYGLPMVAVFLPVMAWYLWRTSHVEVDSQRFKEVARLAIEERRRLGRPDRDQMVVLGVFVAVAAGWLTETWHGVHAGIVALIGAVALFALGKLEPDDLKRISWSSLLTFGGGLVLGIFIVRTGTSDYVATRLAALSGATELVTLLVIATITLVLTTVASNTASAAVLIPLAIPLAGVLGLDPTLLVVTVAIASSIDFALVIGTPPTMIAYSTDLYSAGQIFRKGAVLDLVGILALVLVVTRLWEIIGLL